MPREGRMEAERWTERRAVRETERDTNRNSEVGRKRGTEG